MRWFSDPSPSAVAEALRAAAPTARRLLHQIRVLAALARDPAVPFLPEVVASGTDPVILVTRRVRGSSLFKVADSIDRDHAGRQIARFLRTPGEWVTDIGIRFRSLGGQFTE